ncbi:hypothetical protein GCM10007874_50760 [Labrys miyagiensis]|uniref:Uncharacterized protein n=1 Tax=Labrys miyagiensis TaxID=346912 RepID=A0ABQ6CPG7_9HYPH|nr:hypothetical protein [Labrys miyagiensis]GLS22059.1 hypothetical protein GCM10007874_50760 [Labrys miyagiensis]
MADSETSTSLPIVSRRRLISTGLAASTAPFLPYIANGSKGTDPAVDAWRAWDAASRASLALCRKQQRLETRLQRMVGPPQIVHIPADGSKPIRITCVRDVERLDRNDPTTATLRIQALSQLEQHRLRWEDADRRIGYSAALAEEAAAFDYEQQLAEALWSMAPSSLSGVTAKLDAVLRSGEPSEDSDEFPWPQLRLILADLRRLTQDDHERFSEGAIERA